MPLGIYKPGQGYWVRVMSAVMAGVLVLAGGAWAWKQAALIRPPIPQWRLTLRSVQGEPAVGQEVVLIGTNPLTGQRASELGRAVIEEVEPNRIVVGQLAFEKGLNPSQADHVQSESGFRARVVGSSGIPAYEPILVQLAAMGVVMVIGAGLIYYFVGVHRGSVEFLIATDGEMKKVHWTTRKQIIGSTWVVLFACFLIAAFLFGVDYIFAQIFMALDVLETTRG